MINPETQNTEQPAYTPPVQPPYGQPVPPSAMPYYAERITKPPHTVKPYDGLFAWLMIPLGFLFLRYIVVYADGFVTTGVFLLLFALGAAYLLKNGCKPTAGQWLSGAVICAFTAVFSLTASALLHGLCFLFLLAAFAWWMQAVGGKVPFVTRYFALDLGDALLVQPFREMGAAPAAISASVKKSESAKTARTVLLGLLVTVPLTVIVGVLLASADSAVEEIFTQLGALITDDIVTIIAEIAFGIPAAFLLFGACRSGADRRDNPMPDDGTHAERLSALRFIPNLGLYAGVTPICLLYLLYVCTQTSYFFSAFAGKLPEDMIYSEYARRGFFELCAIAVINLAVLLVMNACAKKGGRERPKALSFYVTLLCCFTLFIIATALAKMLLYIGAYGLTRLRLYTAWFMVLLAVVFLVLIVRQFVRKFPTAAVLTAVFLVMFGGLCFSRPDARIAEYNLTRYEQHTLPELDLDALTDLSDDAYVIIVQHFDALNESQQAFFTKQLRTRLGSYTESRDETWNASAQWLLHHALEMPQ
ncbi:MAG: DUF4173 domain-containing protein [Oscillospiraceae bacterium]|nr:DUF4173 domain-containing protein [Oscillospiraceae bacterium]